MVYSDNLDTSMVSLRRSGRRAAGCISRVRATRKSDTASRWPFVRIWRQERGNWSELLNESGRGEEMLEEDGGDGDDGSESERVRMSIMIMVTLILMSDSNHGEEG